MNKILFLTILLILPLKTFCQNIKDRDSLILIMCQDLDKNTHLKDSLRINKIYSEHFYPYLSKFNENQVDSIARGVYYRFQKNCPEFLRILQNNNPGKGDWEIISKENKPNSSAKTVDCKSLTSLNSLSYLEHNGDRVLVKIEDGYWVEKFVDGTYSKLNFNWINACEFELIFLESNNESIGNMSKMGDKFNYEIITKEETYLSIIAFIPKQDMYLKFKLYYN